MKRNQSPDWRRRRAVELIDNDLKPSRSRDDNVVRQIWRFLKRRRRLDVRAEERLANDMPELYAAFDINEDTDCGLRWIFEASVMANRSLAEMSDYLRTEIEILEIYEAAFFDVRDALASGGCVIGNVLMPLATNSVLPRDPDVMWKGLAYYGNWDVVKMCWEVGRAAPSAIDFFNKANNERIIANAFSALHATHINSFNAVDYVRLALDKQRQDFEMGTAASGNQATSALTGLMDSIRTHVRHEDEELPAEEARLQLVQPPKIIDVPGEEKKAENE